MKWPSAQRRVCSHRASAVQTAKLISFRVCLMWRFWILLRFVFFLSLHGFHVIISLGRDRRQVERASLESIARARARPHWRRAERLRLLLVVELGALRWGRRARRPIRTPLCLSSRCDGQRSFCSWCFRGQWCWWRWREQRASGMRASRELAGRQSVGHVEPPHARGRVACAPLRLLRPLLLRALPLERRAPRAGATHSQLGLHAAPGAILQYAYEYLVLFACFPNLLSKRCVPSHCII